jgi:hypothetical protein
MAAKLVRGFLIDQLVLSSVSTDPSINERSV